MKIVGNTRKISVSCKISCFGNVCPQIETPQRLYTDLISARMAKEIQRLVGQSWETKTFRGTVWLENQFWTSIPNLTTPSRSSLNSIAKSSWWSFWTGTSTITWPISKNRPYETCEISLSAARWLSLATALINLNTWLTVDLNCTTLCKALKKFLSSNNRKKQLKSVQNTRLIRF